MAMQKRNLNTVYISERLRESLRPISHCALTTVVAPMGYGKTTAVNWYLSQWASEAARIIRVSVYSDNLAIFWQSVQSAFCHGGLSFLSGYPCPADAAGGSLLADELCHRLAGETEFFIFLDDFHLLTDGRIPGFLCTLAGRLPENVHIIAASRDRFLPRDAMLRLGRRACSIGIQQLRLNHTELAVYTRRCGIRLTDRQVDDLLYTTEGWFSAVYLNLCSLADRGQLPSHASDIYDMFTAAMLDPLPPEQQEFLAVLGLADEFTADMAEFVTENAQTRALLTGLTEQNAFAQRLPDSETFRFHHMMKSCAQRLFQTLPSQKQAQYLHRYAAWYEQHGQYIHALSAYRRCGDFDDALRVIQRDAGILLAALEPAQVLSFLETCPTQVLKRHPFSLLVLMRRMFTWRQIPKMMELKALLLAAVEEDTALTEAERGNLLGECDLILSFLSYNDISAMSRLHRSASRQMSRPAISIKASGGWTFGSPSVLMMFHREPGALPRELAEMDECMPHYYQVTSGHGQGSGLFAGPLCRRADRPGAHLCPDRPQRPGEHGPVLRLSQLAAGPVRGHPAPGHLRPAKGGAAGPAQHGLAAYSGQHQRLLSRAGPPAGEDPGAVPGAPALHRELPRPRQAHDGSDRKPGVSRPGLLRPGHRPQ